MSPAVIYVGLYWCFHACTLYLLLSLKIRIVFWHLQVVFIDFWFFLYMQDFIDYKLWEQFINGNQYRLTTQYGSNRWHAELLISCPGLQSRSCLAQQVWVAFWFLFFIWVNGLQVYMLCKASPPEVSWFPATGQHLKNSVHMMSGLVLRDQNCIPSDRFSVKFPIDSLTFDFDYHWSRYCIDCRQAWPLHWS